MFKSGSKFMDDIARMAGGTVGILNSLKQELQEDIKERVDLMAERLDLVPRADLEKLEARIEALEKVHGIKKAKTKSTTTKAKAKPKAKASSAKKATKKAPAKKTAAKKKPAKKTSAKKAKS